MSWATSFTLSYSTSAYISGLYTYHTPEIREVKVLGYQLRLVLWHIGVHQRALYLSHTGEWRGKCPGRPASFCPITPRPTSADSTPTTPRGLERLKSWGTSFALSYGTLASISGPYTYHTQENGEARVLGDQLHFLLQHLVLHQWPLQTPQIGEWRSKRRINHSSTQFF